MEGLTWQYRFIICVNYILFQNTTETRKVRQISAVFLNDAMNSVNFIAELFHLFIKSCSINPQAGAKLNARIQIPLEDLLHPGILTNIAESKVVQMSWTLDVQWSFQNSKSSNWFHVKLLWFDNDVIWPMMKFLSSNHGGHVFDWTFAILSQLSSCSSCRCGPQHIKICIFFK